MKPSTILTALLLALTALVASCQSPPPSKFDRQLNKEKFRAGGYNPGSFKPH